MRDLQKSNTGILIQARMGAERLPGKILKPLAGADPVLKWVIERSRNVKHAQRVIVATTVQPGDDAVERYCREHKVDYFRGSEADVFERFYQCAKKFNLDAVVRVTADCPFLSAETIDAAIARFWETGCDYLNNSRITKTYPRGLDVEVFSMAVMDKLAQKNLTPDEREHVTLYIYQHASEFHIETLEAPAELREPQLRLTLDTEDDYKMLNAVAQAFRAESFKVKSECIIDYLRKNPQVAALNGHIEQKRINGKII